MLMIGEKPQQNVRASRPDHPQNTQYWREIRRKLRPIREKISEVLVEMQKHRTATRSSYKRAPTGGSRDEHLRSATGALQSLPSDASSSVSARSVLGFRLRFDAMSTGHQPGLFKRPAKPHKTFKGKRSKGQIDAENRGMY